ncbi:M28 family peptidase [Flavobacterium soli]|uniref:M28 family peptidase n=1 Tax=Flavobacterium soli TaxID=344881 RepID=UPI00042823FE|nr:M28 family peptidase [Flavobacterium soli]
MKKYYASFLSALFLVATTYLVYFLIMPQSVPETEGSLSEFSTLRALKKLENITQEPHYVGSKNHKTVAGYLKEELEALGLETSIQEGYSFSEWGNLVKSKNILARIKGTDNSKALMLLSHYDSAPHSKSLGASDDGSGIVTILEGIRTFLHNKTPHKNDIIILFSDAEELGLNGAALFVTQHQWAKDVGVVINFEARGSSGPSYMLMEVNQGNANMVNAFTEANPRFPVSNSLMYSIYKMLPNDTDLTVFRERANIQGFNFAFIDGHFNYHTAQDDLQHMSKNTLAHQGTYLMPLLNHFSNIDLKTLDATEDKVYFNTPIAFMSYPFSWNIPLVVIAFVLFLGLCFVGFGKRILNGREILKGFVLFFGALLVAGFITFLGWRIVLEIYPEYKEILQGFTYNGHAYIGAFLFLTLSILFFFYRKFIPENQLMNFSIAPLLVWIIINLALAIALPGAGFFILPVFGSLIMFSYFILTQRTSTFINLLFALPALIIYVPFVTMFPVGLGLKMLFGSAMLLVLVFGLLLPVMGKFNKKGAWSFLMLLVSIGFFVDAHIHSGFEAGTAKPNSLLYVYDADQDKAVWTTYDKKLDEWTRNYLGDDPKPATGLNKNALLSKYNSGLSFMAPAPEKELQQPTISFLRDTIIGNQRHLKIKISPNRNVNRYDIFAEEKAVIHNLRANNQKLLGQEGSIHPRHGRILVSYYVTDNEPLELQFSTPKATVLDLELMESSFDLLESSMFSIPNRPASMMPKPFILNDAIVLKQKIKPSPKAEIILPVSDTITTPNVEN